MIKSLEVNYEPNPINIWVQRTLLLFIYLVAFLSFCTFYDRAMFLDGDSPWHIAAGDYIRKIGAVPDYDPWGYTNSGYIWYNLSWAYDVFVSYLNQYFDLKGLIFIHALLAACIPTLLAYICFMQGFGVIPVLVSASFAILMTDSFFSIRPQLIATLILTLSYLELTKFRGKISRTILLLPIYAVLLANTHGSYMVLFVFGSVFGFEFLVRKDYLRFKILSLIGGLCLLATLVNPVGIYVFAAAMRTLGEPYVQSYIQEWQPALIDTHPHIYVYIISALAAPLIYTFRVPLADKILMVLWCILTIKSSRYNSILLIVITPFIASFLHETIKHFISLQKAEQTVNSDLSNKLYPRNLAIIALCIFVGTAFLIKQHIIWDQELYDSKKYPVAEIDYLLKKQTPMRLVNEYGFGGYLIYQGQGKIRPFIDGRAGTAYPKQVFEDNVVLCEFRPGWEKLIEQYQIDTMLLKPKACEVDAYVNTGKWRIAYKGEIATVLEKK